MRADISTAQTHPMLTATGDARETGTTAQYVDTETPASDTSASTEAFPLTGPDAALFDNDTSENNNENGELATNNFGLINESVAAYDGSNDDVTAFTFDNITGVPWRGLDVNSSQSTADVDIGTYDSQGEENVTQYSIPEATVQENITVETTLGYTNITPDSITTPNQPQGTYNIYIQWGYLCLLFSSYDESVIALILNIYSSRAALPEGNIFNIRVITDLDGGGHFSETWYLDVQTKLVWLRDKLSKI